MTMVSFLGYLAMAIILAAYTSMITTKNYLFAPLSFVGSVLFTAYSILIKDVPFTVVNGLIAGLMLIKITQRKPQKAEKREVIRGE